MTALSVTLELPVDVEAEEAVAGMAVEIPRGAALAVAHLEPADFYDRTLARIVWCAAEGPELLTEDTSGRLERIARRTDVPVVRLWQLCRLPRICDVDTKGHYLRRLTAASEKRQALIALVEELQAA